MIVSPFVRVFNLSLPLWEFLLFSPTICFILWRSCLLLLWILGWKISHSQLMRRRNLFSIRVRMGALLSLLIYASMEGFSLIGWSILMLWNIALPVFGDLEKVSVSKKSTNSFSFSNFSILLIWREFLREVHGLLTTTYSFSTI